MQGRCDTHMFEHAVDVCGLCLEEFCGDCVVYPYGPAKLPYCRRCAVRAAGVSYRSPIPTVGRSHRSEAMRRRQQLQLRLRAS